MMRLLPSWRFFGALVSLVFAGFIIFLSLWRLNVAATGKEERGYSSSVSVTARLHQMFTPPILPDHPLYLFGMLSDRIDLIFAPRDEQFFMRLRYADVRLVTARELLARGRTSLALTTVTKAEKYILSAAYSIPQLPIDVRAKAREKLFATIVLHKDQLTSMKPYFSDAQRATIDSLIEQILILRTNL